MGVAWILLRLFFVGLMGYVLYKLLWKAPAASSKRTTDKLPEPMERDPVCGAFIPRSQAVIGRHKKESYHFCSEKCLQEFNRDPDRYLN